MKKSCFVGAAPGRRQPQDMLKSVSSQCLQASADTGAHIRCFHKVQRELKRHASRSVQKQDAQKSEGVTCGTEMSVSSLVSDHYTPLIRLSLILNHKDDSLQTFLRSWRRPELKKLGNSESPEVLPRRWRPIEELLDTELLRQKSSRGTVRTGFLSISPTRGLFYLT